MCYLSLLKYSQYSQPRVPQANVIVCKGAIFLVHNPRKVQLLQTPAALGALFNNIPSVVVSIGGYWCLPPHNHPRSVNKCSTLLIEINIRSVKKLEPDRVV